MADAMLRHSPLLILATWIGQDGLDLFNHCESRVGREKLSLLTSLFSSPLVLFFSPLPLSLLYIYIAFELETNRSIIRTRPSLRWVGWQRWLRRLHPLRVGGPCLKFRVCALVTSSSPDHLDGVLLLGEPRCR